MKLYLVHCGFYDLELSDGIYESHVNFFVVAENFETARMQVRDISEFKAKKMHIDGIQEIRAVQGYRITMEKDATLGNGSLVLSHRHRDLAATSRSRISEQELNTV